MNLTQSNTNLATLKSQEKNIISNLSSLEKRKITLSYDRQDEQESISQRIIKIQELCTALGIGNDCDSQSSDESIVDVLTQININLRKEEKSVRDLSKSHDNEDKELQKNIDKLRESMASMKNEIQSKQKLINLRTIEANKLKDEINLVEKSAEKLKMLSNQVEKLNKEIETTSQRIDLEQMNENIKQKKIHRETLQENLDKIDEQLTFLNSISNFTTQINVKKQQLETRENEVKRVKNKHSNNLKSLFKNNIPESNFKRSAENLQHKISNEIRELDKNIIKCKTRRTQLETNRVNMKNDLNKLEKEKSEGTDEMFNNCDGSEYEDVVAKLKEKIEKMQLDYGAAKSSEVLYKKYINQMEGEPCCPLCHKDMSGSEVFIYFFLYIFLV